MAVSRVSSNCSLYPRGQSMALSGSSLLESESLERRKRQLHQEQLIYHISDRVGRHQQDVDRS